MLKTSKKNDFASLVASAMMLVTSLAVTPSRVPEARAEAFGIETIKTLASARATPRMQEASQNALGAIGAIDDTFSQHLAPLQPSLRGQIVQLRFTKA